MKPICLHGHERSITKICYNREGDLIFTAAKNPQANVWFAANGERLGSFEGHNGAIWWIDVDWDSTRFLTASSDNSCRVWDLSTGTALHCLTTKTAVRTCGFNYAGNMMMMTTDKAMGYPCQMMLFDLRDNTQMSSSGEDCVWRCDMKNTSKITSAVWGPLGNTIITGHEQGEVCQVEAKSGTVLHKVEAHEGPVTDIQLHADMTMFITSSKDKTAKLFGSYDLDILKTYSTERPVNSAAISPIRDHVLLGGGQEAREVTTTASREGKFDARFFHLVYGEEFGRVKGHFGPINSVAFSPDGKGFCTGGEDGYVRMHVFDPEYFHFEIEC